MRAKLLSSLLIASLFVVGCASRPTLVAPKDRRAIDRSLIEFPAGFELQIVARGLTGPVAIAFDDSDPVNRGSILVAESGNAGDGPRVYGFRPDGTRFDVYPRTRSFPLNLFGGSFEISGDRRMGAHTLAERTNQGPRKSWRFWWRRLCH